MILSFDSKIDLSYQAYAYTCFYSSIRFFIQINCFDLNTTYKIFESKVRSCLDKSGSHAICKSFVNAMYDVNIKSLKYIRTSSACIFNCSTNIQATLYPQFVPWNNKNCFYFYSFSYLNKRDAWCIQIFKFRLF